MYMKKLEYIHVNFRIKEFDRKGMRLCSLQMLQKRSKVIVFITFSNSFYRTKKHHLDFKDKKRENSKSKRPCRTREVIEWRDSKHKKNKQQGDTASTKETN